ncbi:MAG: hypothetical protein ACM3S5_12470 [Rhodospirillales bacterium]
MYRWLVDDSGNVTSKMSLRRQLLILALFTLLLHIPFLRQPVQGDEVTYLEIAANALKQPVTPLNFSYVFQGRLVDASGHPHPPLNAYIAAVPWLLIGRFSVLGFHTFYLLFALGISFAAYALASRFTTQPLWAGLLVAASPLVQVNTNTLASPEAPGLAFLLAGAAAFFFRRFGLCGIALALAGLTALQALALPPILLLAYAWKRERPPKAAWLALAAPYVALAAWQGLQWTLTGRLPAALLLGNVSDPAFSRAPLKAASALALLQHLGSLVIFAPLAVRRLWGVAPGLAAAALVRDYPWWERALLVVFIALGVNALVWLWQSRKREPVLASWCLLYFAFSCVAFFAGASRYLLPLVAPMVVLFVQQFAQRRRWIKLALVWSAFLGLNLSFAAFEFSRVYAEIEPPPGKTYLVNGEWGFRFYMQARGGRALERRSVPQPGEWIVSSELSLAGNYDSLAEETAIPIRTTDLTVRTPLRLIDRFAHSGFSAASAGLLPFSFSWAPLDRIHHARTSPFLDEPAEWIPTQFSGRLVFLPRPGAAVRLPIDAGESSLRFALFGQGKGQAAFRITTASGGVLFEKITEIDGELWETHSVPLEGTNEVVLTVGSEPGLRAGWGELTPCCGGDSAGPAPAGPAWSFLKLGDIRSRPQLLSGWHAIEDGGWRWMAQEATAVLRVPADPPATFELQLYFPPDYIERAGGPATVSVLIDGRPFAQETYNQPGGYRLVRPVPDGLLTPPESRMEIRLNRVIPPTGADRRELGAVVQEFGFTR